MINSKKVKEIMLSLGAELYGIASIDRFGDDEEKKTWTIACHKCRDICPHNLGSENSFI